MTFVLIIFSPASVFHRKLRAGEDSCRQRDHPPHTTAGTKGASEEADVVWNITQKQFVFMNCSPWVYRAASVADAGGHPNTRSAQALQDLRTILLIRSNIATTLSILEFRKANVVPLRVCRQEMRWCIRRFRTPQGYHSRK